MVSTLDIVTPAFVDTWIDGVVANQNINYGSSNTMSVGHAIAAPFENYWSLLQFRIPDLPAGTLITGMRMRLYRASSTNDGNWYDVAVYFMDQEFGELDATWLQSYFGKAWVGGTRKHFCDMQSVHFNVGAFEPYTWSLDPIVRQLNPKGGELITLIVREGAINNSQFVVFAAREWVGANQDLYRPHFYIDVIAESVNNLAIAPDPADKRRPKLTWTPAKGFKTVNQKVYRGLASGFAPSAGTLVATLGPNEVSCTDTTIDAAANDNTTFYYLIVTEGDYNTVDNGFRSNEVNFIRPAVTVFSVATVVGGLEGANINVLDKVVSAITAVGGTINKNYCDFGDLGTRWADPTISMYHNYTTTGVKTVYARAQNSLGYWSNLYAPTAGHVNPNPQLIVPIADLVQFPTALKPYQKLILDASDSYDRQSNGVINTYDFNSDQVIYGLPAMPTAQPVCKAYFKAPFTANQHVHIAATGGNSVSASYPVVVANETIRILTSLSGYDRALITGRKSENLDESSKVGARGPDIIQTGGGTTRLRLQVLVRGATPEATVRTLRSWWENGDLLDIPLPNDAGAAAVEIYRCVFASSNFEIRGGEPNARHIEFEVAVKRKLVKVVDEAVNFAAGVGVTAHGPIADASRDGTYTDDVTVRTAAGGGGANKPVSGIDYVADDPDTTLDEVTLVDNAYNAVGYVTYWYEVEV